MWSLVYLATISTSWPRSSGICTFTSAAPSASWGSTDIERGTDSSPPALTLALPLLLLSMLWLLLCLFESPSSGCQALGTPVACTPRLSCIPGLPPQASPGCFPRSPKTPRGRQAVPTQLWLGLLQTLD